LAGKHEKRGFWRLKKYQRKTARAELPFETRTPSKRAGLESESTDTHNFADQKERETKKP